MKRLTRSRDDVVLSGVLAGIGDYLNVDPTLVRIIFLVIVFTGIGAGLIVPLYIAGAIIIPKEPLDSTKQRKRKRRRKDFKTKKPFNREERREDKARETRSIEEDDWSDF